MVYLDLRPQLKNLPSSNMAPLKLLFLLSFANRLQATKLLVATGDPWNASVYTEVIDLGDESTTCDELGEYPIAVEGASGGLVNQSLPLICGGYNGRFINNCYIVGSAASDPVVKLLAPRESSAAVAMSSHQLWVTGGYVYGSSSDSTSEIVDVLAFPPTVIPGPELPVPMADHCIVKLNTSTVLFMGGDPHNTKTFFYDISTQTWTRGPYMKYPRIDFGCGMMQITNGSFMVVATGGWANPSTTELLVLDNPNGLNWSYGPDLPQPLYGHQMVNFDGSAITIGGISDGLADSNSLYKLICSDKCQWGEMSQKLTVARGDFVAMIILDEMANCQKSK